MYRITSIKAFKQGKKKLLENGNFNEVQPWIWGELSDKDLFEKVSYSVRTGHILETSFMEQMHWWIEYVPKKDLKEMFNPERLKVKLWSGNSVMHEVLRNQCLDKIPIENVTLENLISDNGSYTVINFLEMSIYDRSIKEEVVKKLLNIKNLSVKGLKKEKRSILLKTAKLLSNSNCKTELAQLIHRVKGVITLRELKKEEGINL